MDQATMLSFLDARYDDELARVLIEEVQEEYVVRYGGRDDTPVDPEQFAPPHGAFLVLTVDDVPAGCVGLRRHGDGVVEMKRMFVRSAYRGRGLGRALLAALEERARELGYRRIILETGLRQPEAMALYESAGYARIEPYGFYAGYPNVRCYGKDLLA